MNIPLDDLLKGSRAIDFARDDVRRCLYIVESSHDGKGLAKNGFILPVTELMYWWEMRRGGGGKTFFQLWEGYGWGHAGRLWEGYANDAPPAETVMLVRLALPFLLEACLAQIPGFEAKVQPYLSAASKT